MGTNFGTSDNGSIDHSLCRLRHIKYANRRKCRNYFNSRSGTFSAGYLRVQYRDFYRQQYRYQKCRTCDLSGMVSGRSGGGVWLPVLLFQYGRFHMGWRQRKLCGHVRRQLHHWKGNCLWRRHGIRCQRGTNSFRSRDLFRQCRQRSCSGRNFLERSCNAERTGRALSAVGMDSQWNKYSGNFHV